MRLLLTCWGLSLLACSTQPSGSAADTASRDTAGQQPQSPPAQSVSDLIQIESPAPRQVIRSPLTIRGKARGPWYFEGDFPVELQDKNRNTLATGIAKAKGRWMTRDFVPFELQLKFKAPQAEPGYLLFKKANASGRPEHEQHYRLPILFPSD
jgi:hypothetical protein